MILKSNNEMEYQFAYITYCIFPHSCDVYMIVVPPLGVAAHSQLMPCVLMVKGCVHIEHIGSCQTQ